MFTNLLFLEQPFSCRIIIAIQNSQIQCNLEMSFEIAFFHASLRITCNSHLGFKASSFDKILLAILHRNCATKNFTTLEACMRLGSQWHKFPKWVTNIRRANVRKLESQNANRTDLSENLLNDELKMIYIHLEIQDLCQIHSVYVLDKH